MNFSFFNYFNITTHFFKVLIKPTLVLLKSIFLTISLDPGFKQAAEIKNAADDGSPGTL